MKRAFLLGLLLLSSIALAVNSNSAYIHDIENLLNSVPSKDPSRQQLTLKLADAFFNEALNMAGNPSMTAREKDQVAAHRRKAIQLYRESLSGLNGLFPAPSGAAKGKIQFQLARLYSDLGEAASAQQIWRELAGQDSMPDLQRESLLRLAEVLENRSNRADLKQAENDYLKAQSLCSTQDVCSYTHYRLAWVYEREERSKEAVTEIEKALWDSKGQVREEALRDMTAFMGSLGDDGKDSLEKMEKLSDKLKRPSLISELSDAYFAHGNRRAGVYVLDAVNRKKPTLKSYVRLLEEDYGFRDWGKFDAGLDGAMDLLSKGESLKGDVEAEKIMRRLTVQLDGERTTQPKNAEEFKRAVMLYLALFPDKINERKQMIDGWLAAEKEDAPKINQLKIWIAEEEAAKRDKEAVRLRKIRASLAQKAKDYSIVAEEMSALKPFAEGAAQKRETIYQLAYAQYQNKDYATALPKFLELATIPNGSFTPDKWAIQSEHLSLDIMAQKKDYQAVVLQAQKWTKDSRFPMWLATNKEFQSELSDMKKIETSSEFEWATSMGNSPEALAIFNKDCQAGILLPQSCSNAQVVAVKTGSQKTLIEVLQKQGKKDELASELEASAEFTQAAQMLENKMKEKPGTTRDYLKVALLYELGGSNVNRDRILHQLVARLATAKTMGEEEDLILQTLRDTSLIDASTLKLPWKKENKDFLTDYVAGMGKGNAELRTQLAKSCRDLGPTWRHVSLDELKRLDANQSQIHFAGKASKRKFELRVAGLKTLLDRGSCYLQSTSAEQRVIFGTLLSRAESKLADEIKAAPIPEGVDEAGKASLQKALEEMAQPFADKAQEFDKLVAEQLEKVEDVSAREDLKAKIAAGDNSLYTNAANTSPREPLKNAVPQNHETLKTALEGLHRNPNQRSSLSQLKEYYELAGQKRLAAYFQGRLLQLNEEVKQ